MSVSVHEESHEAAIREVLGKRFFGVAEWERIGKFFSSDELSRIPPFPIDLEKLHAPWPFGGTKIVGDTHFFFLGISRFSEEPLTILEWHRMRNIQKNGWPELDLSQNPWCERDAFATESVCRHLHWYAVLINTVPHSLNLPLCQQKKLINVPSYWIPSGIVEVTKNALHFLNHGFYPNQGVGATCADILPDGCGVWVGANQEGKSIMVEKRWDLKARERLGIGGELRIRAH